VRHCDVANWHCTELRVLHVACKEARGLTVIERGSVPSAVAQPFLTHRPERVFVMGNVLLLKMLFVCLWMNPARDKAGCSVTKLTSVRDREIGKSAEGVTAILAIQPVVKFPHLRT
jgi:hypothetical protein